MLDLCHDFYMVSSGATSGLANFRLPPFFEIFSGFIRDSFQNPVTGNANQGGPRKLLPADNLAQQAKPQKLIPALFYY